ncbi:MAG: tetratricopeptide repeat protein [Minwuia sp.]|uniref:tetratricopeptide repeat protein n=1 Tax=Minwuia sp. TaxID=2493630 RepID=UPI003A8785F8
MALALFAPLQKSAAGVQDGAAALERGEYAKAFEIWQPLAEEGDPLAQYNLAQLLRTGHGVSRDFVLAAYWYRQAAEQGFARAQYNLGLMNLNGDGLAKDPSMAAHWFLKSAENRHVDAQIQLGLLHLKGFHPEADVGRGAMWIEIAAYNGSATALKLLEEVLESMTPAQAERSTDLVRQCISRQFRDC